MGLQNPPVGTGNAGRFDQLPDVDLTGFDLVGGKYRSKAGASSGLTTVATIAALKAIATAGLTSGASVRGVHGYYAGGDKAGFRAYEFRSGLPGDNGGTVIHATDGGGHWYLLEDPLDLKVTWFGARGTNHADNDALAFDRAIRAMGTSFGGRLQVPTGIYNFDTGLPDYVDQYHVLVDGLGAPANNEGQGQLPGATIKFRAAGITAFSLRGTVDATLAGATKQSGPRFRNINFENRSASSRSGTAIRSRLVNRGYIEGCTFYDLADCFVNVSEQGGYGDETGVGGSTDASWWEYVGNHSKNCQRTVYVPHSGNVHAYGGSIYATEPPVAGSRGLHIVGGGHHRIHDMKIEACEIGVDFQASMGHIHDISSEDCQTFVRVQRFSATSINSGQQVSLDGISASRNTVLASVAAGIVVGPNTEVTVGPRRFFKGISAGRGIINQGSTALKVAQPALVASNYAE